MAFGVGHSSNDGLETSPRSPPTSPGFSGLALQLLLGRWLAIISCLYHLSAILQLFFLFSWKPGHPQMQEWKRVGRGSQSSDCHLQAHRRPAGACRLFSGSVATVAISEPLLPAASPRWTGSRKVRMESPQCATVYSQGCPLVPDDILVFFCFSFLFLMNKGTWVGRRR